MTARSFAVLVIALATTLGSVAVAGARNGPIAWEQLQRAGPATVESDSAGGEIRDLLGPAVRRSGPGVFSPTGDRYAYNGIGRGGISRVFVAHLFGSRAGTQEELLSASGSAGFRIADWSPDASRVLYYYEEDFGRTDIAPEHHLAVDRMDIPGGASSPVSLPRGIVPFAGGSFFPDSRTIVIAASLQLVGSGGPGFLLRANVDGGDLTPIPADLKLDGIDGVPRDPAVSPDGTKIAYSLDLSPQGRGAVNDLASLVVINADGSGRRVLTRGRRDTRPKWSPDGQMLTFERQTRLARDCGSSGVCYFEYEVFVIGADGRGEANFSNSPPYNFAPDWRPARPSATPVQTAPLVTLLEGSASLPLAPGKSVSLQVLCPKGPRNCAGVATLLAGKHEVLEKRFSVRAGRSSVLRSRIKGRTLDTKAPVALRLVTKAGRRRYPSQAITLKRQAGLDLSCPATGRADEPLLFRGRLRAPGKAAARALRVHLENEESGLALDRSVRTSKNGTFGLSAPLPSDGTWTVALAWLGDRAAFGRAAVCRVVLRGPPRVDVTRPGEDAVVVADSDLVLEGAAGDTIDGALGPAALAWTIDGVPAGSGRTLTARIHALGRHVVTLTATNAAGISASDSVGIDVVRPVTEPVVSITAPKDGDDLPKAPTDFVAQASDAYDGQLTGGSLTWRDRYTSDDDVKHDELMGTGERVTKTLYAGASATEHVITATATNSAGTTKTVSITVTAN